MRYIDNNLLDSEKVIYATHPSLIVFGSTVICLFFSGMIYFYGQANDVFHTSIMGWPLYVLASLFFIAYSVYLGLYAMVRYYTSEYGITDKRVIMKVGLIQRDIFETFLTRTEGIKVWQSVFGRLFNYGTITVVGTGGTNDSFRQVPNPLHFRHVLQEELDRELRSFGAESTRN